MERQSPRLELTELHRSLRNLVGIGRRAVDAYAAAEAQVIDHRLQAALEQLRLAHDRHVVELAALLQELGGHDVVTDGASPPTAVHDALARGQVDGPALLDAVRRMEAELLAAYQSAVDRAIAEPVRGVLSRHRSEEQAHVEWLNESPLWQGSAGDLRQPQQAGD